MNKYQSFIFKNYELKDKTLTLTYSLDDAITFNETYKFDFDFVPTLNPESLDRAIQNLFFMAGVSYFKTYLPDKILVETGSLNTEAANFFSKTYQKGLGEFFYVNKLDPKTQIEFPATQSETINKLSNHGSGLLIGIGGGKDSLLSVELLKNQPRAATWSVGNRSQLEPLVQKIGLNHFWVERTWDQKLLELNAAGAYNGHIPISAVLACVGAVVAVLAGYSDVVVSNENSANEPNFSYRGVEINHQYSKSLEFEKDFQGLLYSQFSSGLNYFSFLRPLSELKIAELFSKVGFEKYKSVFSSCNRAFVGTSDHIFWCGECPKCAFTFLIFTPFIDRAELEKLFDGKNLLLDPSLETTYRQLLGIEGDKPLECVGEIKEARGAMQLAKQKYPELVKYQYELPEDYAYSALSPHSMPSEYFEILRSAVRRL